MKILFTILLLPVFTATIAQKKFSLKDTTITINNNIIHITEKGITVSNTSEPNSKMPNALKGYQQSLSNPQTATHLFNSAQSSVDNMAILQPNDKNLAALNMPVHDNYNKNLPLSADTLKVVNELDKSIQPPTSKSSKLKDLKVSLPH